MRDRAKMEAPNMAKECLLTENLKKLKDQRTNTKTPLELSWLASRA